MRKKLPVEIVFHPSWWNRHVGIEFDQDFFYNAQRRVQDEMKMENELFRRFGDLGLGSDHDKALPVVGAVHNAAGYLLAEMLGASIEYYRNAPPQVICPHLEGFEVDEEKAFNHPSFLRLQQMIATLKEQYGYVCGDINWGGVLNLAIDLKGENVLMDMLLNPEECRQYFNKLAHLIERFFCYIQKECGSNSISVNRIVRHFQEPVYLHSECTHTMISEDDYENLLMPIDDQWSRQYRPFGIHYCGKDPHRYAHKFSKLAHLDFLDLGWGGDVKVLREQLPDTFFSLRLNPVDLNSYSPAELRQIIRDKVIESGDPYLTGVCCVNMDDTITDDKIRIIYETVDELRNN